MSTSTNSPRPSPVAPTPAENSSQGNSGEIRDSLRDVQVRLQCLEDKTVKLTGVIKELSDLMKKHCKSSFTIKGSPLEVCIVLVAKQHPD